MAKQSRIRRLYSKKLARRLAEARGERREELASFAEREAEETIARMRGKGWELAARLADGEAVFVRDEGVVGLHIQLPAALYRLLDEECRRRDTTKRQLVIVALEKYLGR